MAKETQIVAATSSDVADTAESTEVRASTASPDPEAPDPGALELEDVFEPGPAWVESRFDV